MVVWEGQVLRYSSNRPKTNQIDARLNIVYTILNEISLQDAQVCLGMGISLYDATDYLNEGLTLDELLRSHTSKDYFPGIQSWLDKGFSHRDALDWHTCGFRVDPHRWRLDDPSVDAVGWRGAGFNSTSARLAVERGFTPDTASVDM